LGILSLLLEVSLNLPDQDHPAQQQYRREVAWGLPMSSLVNRWQLCNNGKTLLTWESVGSLEEIGINENFLPEVISSEKFDQIWNMYAKQ
jgi:hypothetical protein